MVAIAEIDLFARAKASSFHPSIGKRFDAAKDQTSLPVTLNRWKRWQLSTWVDGIGEQCCPHKAAEGKNCERTPVMSPFNSLAVQSGSVQFDNSFESELLIPTIFVDAPTWSHE